VIEKLGFGLAQLRYLVLGHGVWFTESMQLAISAVFTVCLAPQLGWSHSQRALSQSLVFVGILCGSFIGGYVGDIIGRRPPILACYLVATVAQLLHLCTTTYWIFAILRVCLGFAHGMGMPTSIALVSETSPVAYRALLMGIRNVLFGSGSIYAAIVIIIDDASMKNLHWRIDLLTTVVPPAILLLLAWAFLYESPLILARTGRQQEALKSLEAIRGLNGRDASTVDVSFSSDFTEAKVKDTGKKDSFKQLKILFERKMLFNTITLAWASLSMNLLLYGHSYAFSIISTGQARGGSDVSGMLPGYQALIQAVVGLLIILVIVPVGAVLSRKAMLCIGSIFGIGGMILFSLTGGLPERTPFQNGMYFLAQNTPSLSCGCAFLGIYQLAVDLYPVEAASTSAAFVILIGRIGSILAPFIFEAFAAWESFYNLLSITSAITLLMTLWVIRSPAPAEKLALAEKEADMESMPLLKK